MVSLLFRATYGPVLGQGSCLTICCFQKGPGPRGVQSAVSTPS